MRTWFLYCRISDEHKQGEGYSIEAQIEHGRAYAKREAAILPAENIFIEKETAKSSGRPIFEEMLAAIRSQKKPAVLLVEKTDRLYRNLEDHIEVMRLVDKQDLEVHFYKEGEILGKTASSHKKLMHRFKLLMAQNYVENLSEEIKKGTRQKLLNGGWPHQPPPGYRNERKEIVPDERSVEFVKMAFTLYGTGLYSLEALPTKLFELGLVYKPNRIKIPRPVLGKMLRNPFYIGQMVYAGEVYQGKHQPIIDMDVWLKAQMALKKDGKPHSYNKQQFRYARLLRCGECGGGIVGEFKKAGKYVYYRCVKKKKGCSEGYFNERLVDEQIDALIASIQLPENLKSEILQIVQELETYVDETVSDEMRKVETELKRARNALRQAYQDKLEGTIDKSLWQSVSTDYQNSILALEDRLANISKADMNFYELGEMMVELPETLSRKWKQASDDQKTKILFFIGSNFFWKAEKLSYELKEPFDTMVKKGSNTYMVEPESEKSNFWRLYLIQNCNSIRWMHEHLRMVSSF